jgi:hypothetical protein
VLPGAEFSEKFFYVPREGGQDQLGPDIGQGAKDEEALRYSRVGQGKAGGGDDNIPAIEQVEVNYTRAVSRSRWTASKGLFNALKVLEHCVRLFRYRELEDGVKEERGIRGAINGRSFVHL